MSERCPKCNSLLSKSNIIQELCSIDAENSRLKVGDKIIEIDQKPSENFSHIEQHESKVGFVTVKVQRNESTLVFLVKDSPDFFTTEITYKNICPKCDQKKEKSKNLVLPVLITLACIISITLVLAILFYVIWANNLLEK